MFLSLRQAYGKYRKSVRDEGFHVVASQQSFNWFLSLLIFHIIAAITAIYYILQMKLSQYLTLALIILCLIPDIGFILSIMVILYYFMNMNKML